MNVKPAYGRDYKSRKAVQADWDNNLDFIITDIASRWCGSYVNKEQVPNEPVTVRYSKLTKICKVQ